MNMKRKKLRCILVLLLMISLQGVALASSVEITTGGKLEEGVRNRHGGWLKDGSLVQIIKTPSGVPAPPQPSGKPAPPEELINETEIGYNFPFNRDQGKFDFQIWAGGNDKIYVRAWDGSDRYGDSEVYTVRGENVEVWNLRGDVNDPAFNTTNSLEKLK
jgi:hypothetical protein